MTVANHLRQAIASLIGVEASLHTFAIQSQDPRARQAYEKGAEDTRQVVFRLKQRLLRIEQEEPQYQVDARADK
jgi:hypothetical protein